MSTWFRDRPIKQKVTLMVLLISSAVILLSCAAFFGYEFVTFRQATVQHIATLGEIVGNNSTAALAFDTPRDAEDILSALRAESHITAAALYTRDGRLFAHYDRAGSQSVPPDTPGPDEFRFTADSLLSFQPVMEGDRRLGTLYLSTDLEAIYARFRLYGLITLLVFVAAGLLAYALSRVMQRHISAPILALAESARAVSEHHDFSLRVPAVAHDEVGLLTDAFNQMLAKIHELNRDLEARVVERTASLAAVNTELEAFSYSVSHDLRAPLRHIDGFASLLDKRSGATLDATSKRYLTVISDSARRMGRLIDDLLALSRTGRARLSPVETDHHALVTGIITEISASLAKPVTWEIAPLPRVRSDPALIRQVWVNLLDNAVKYSSRVDQPRVSVSAATDPSGEVVFQVRDNGAGFDMAYADKLFGVFQRLHSEAEFEGTGIGLANVRRIVLRHGGRTWAEGRLGEGATFSFSLPASPDQP
ncbi:MAG TPA: ATP-binding protein [Opitutus sp.]|nr:ATP-binding protein [Opitutus sp.]